MGLLSPSDRHHLSTVEIDEAVDQTGMGAFDGIRKVWCNHYRNGRRAVMATAISQQYLDLFQKKAFAQLATLMPDGRPQVTPVWCDFDGSYIRINSAKG